MAQGLVSADTESVDGNDTRGEGWMPPTRRTKRVTSVHLAFALIAFAVLLRFVLAALGWPPMDSDEGTMGLEAWHILSHGEHPIYLYGQNYMGVAEAYLGSFFYRLFGVSLLSLRLGMLLLFAVFLVGIFLLARTLYGARVALATLAFLSFAAFDVLREELMAVGGVAETLACGVFVLLLATWLALPAGGMASGARVPGLRGIHGRWRLLAYAGWGVFAGLGLWSHLLVAPLIAVSALLLLAFRWRELLGLPGIFLVLGLVVGALPLLVYNLHAAPGQNSLAVFLDIRQYQFPGAPTGLALPLKELTGSVLWSIPQATGMSEVCSLGNLPLYARPGHVSWSCVALQGGWGVGYIMLLGWSMLQTVRGLAHTWQRRHAQETDLDAHQALVLATARGCLLLATWLTLISFMFSEIAAEKPWSQRYLIGLLLVTPALIAPLLDPLPDLLAATRSRWHANRRGALFGKEPLWRVAMLMLLFLVPVAGTLYTMSTVPATRAANVQESRFVQDLLASGVTRIYSGYWVCDRLIFESHEHILCGVVEVAPNKTSLRPGLNRYLPYKVAVDRSRNPSYVFPQGSDFEAVFEARLGTMHQRYTRRLLDGYVVYTPVA